LPSALLLLAHHDDEFFLAPVLKEACAAGSVQVVYLTQGGADAAARTAESDRALASLGVDPARVIQLGTETGVEDGTLSLKPTLALAALQRRLAPALFTHIYVPAWEGGHPDHETAHRIGVAFAAGNSPELYEFPLYNAAGMPAGKFRPLQLTPGCMPVLERSVTLEEAEAWRALLAHYPSQQKVFASMRGGIAWCLEVRRSCVYRRVDPARDYTQRPHAGPLFYEQSFGLNFETLRERLAAL
jgi:LmbE family N-acetylglucosaminyl deacetylase